jgi:hypothetical protein
VEVPSNARLARRLRRMSRPKKRLWYEKPSSSKSVGATSISAREPLLAARRDVPRANTIIGMWYWSTGMSSSPALLAQWSATITNTVSEKTRGAPRR